MRNCLSRNAANAAMIACAIEPIAAEARSARASKRGCLRPLPEFMAVACWRGASRRTSALQPGPGEQRIQVLAHHALGGFVQAAENRHRQRAQIGPLAGPLFNGEVGAIHFGFISMMSILTSRDILDTNLMARGNATASTGRKGEML